MSTSAGNELTAVQVDADVVMGCPVCGAERRLPTQPAPVLWDGIHAFRGQHAICLLVEPRPDTGGRARRDVGAGEPPVTESPAGADATVRGELPPGDARDAAATDRDNASDANDQRSEARDKRSDARDARAAARENVGNKHESAGAAWDRTEAKLDRQRSARDREHSGRDRERSGEDREAASADRRGVGPAADH